MGSCSFKRNKVREAGLKTEMISRPISTVTEEGKGCSTENLLYAPRSSKLKQKAPPHEVCKGSIPPPDAPTAQVREVVKSPRDISLISSSFERNFIFNTLSHDQKSDIIDAMKQYSLASNQIIFRQNQQGNNFFIVASGTLQVLVNGSRTNTLSEGTGFGELALMHDTPRTTTVKTVTAAVLWGIDRGTFKKVIEEINIKNYQENKVFIESVPVFAILKPDQIEALVGSMRTLNFNPGQIIVKEGDIGDLLFIIKEGAVSCTRENAEVRRFMKGEYFGEQALLYHSPRTATCIALGTVKCLSIDNESLASALGSQLQKIIFKNSQAIIIEKNQELNKLSREQAERLISEMEIRNCKQGEIVIPRGSLRSRYLIMVLKGELILGNTITSKLECLGFSDVISQSDTVYEEHLLCKENSDIAVISKENFEKCIGGDFLLISMNNEAFKVLRKVEILRDLSQDNLHALISAMKLQRFSKDETIVVQGSPGDSFYIIKSGKVLVKIHGRDIRTITKHDYFGERSVIFNQARTATVIATEEVECWVLFQVDFLRIISQGLRLRLLKRIELQDDNLTLQDLSIVKLLGKGMHGTVFLAIHKSKKLLYALKTVDRRKICAYELYESLNLERKVLLQLDHPFIPKLVKTLKDAKRIYFVLEYVRGMDLFYVIRKMSVVSEADSMFFTACLIVILQHLHEREIVHRDLKPENLVVDQQGYLKLIDFGTAKIVGGRTYTILGTPHYMAPEVILRKGYGLSVDYWSLGVIVYELLFERVPFAEEEEDPMIIYEVVLNDRLRYPSQHETFAEARGLIDQLLNKNPEMRMAGGIERIKAHPWLRRINWGMLLAKALPAPFIPKCKKLDLGLVLGVSIKRSLDSVISSEEINDIPLAQKRIPEKWDKDF